MHQTLRNAYHRLAAAASVAVIALMATPAAHASGSSMPWEAPLQSILESIEGLTAPTVTPKAQAVWHLYTVKFDPSKFSCTRDQFIEALKAEGVPTAVHYPRTTSDQPALAQWNKHDTPVASSLTDRVFCLPMHHGLSDEHFETISSALRKVAGAYTKG